MMPIFADLNSELDVFTQLLQSFFTTSLLLLFIIIVIIAVLVVCTTISLIALWRLFKMAGRPGWHALIPFYNLWALCEIMHWPGYYSLAVIIPAALSDAFKHSSVLSAADTATSNSALFSSVCGIVFLVAWIIGLVRLATTFGRRKIFALCLLIQPLGLIILAFSRKSHYKFAEPSKKSHGKTSHHTKSTTGRSHDDDDPWVNGEK